MMEYTSLENFWKRYNKVLLDKLALDKEKSLLTQVIFFSFFYRMDEDNISNVCTFNIICALCSVMYMYIQGGQVLLIIGLKS